MSSLLPDGIEHFGDAPYTLHQAIATGLRILGYEELPKDERPLKRIWFDGDALTRHWEDVEAKREQRYGPPKPDPSTYEENAVELIKRG